MKNDYFQKIKFILTLIAIISLAYITVYYLHDCMVSEESVYDIKDGLVDNITN